MFDKLLRLGKETAIYGLSSILGRLINFEGATGFGNGPAHAGGGDLEIESADDGKRHNPEHFGFHNSEAVGSPSQNPCRKNYRFTAREPEMVETVQVNYFLRLITRTFATYIALKSWLKLNVTAGGLGVGGGGQAQPVYVQGRFVPAAPPTVCSVVFALAHDPPALGWDNSIVTLGPGL